MRPTVKRMQSTSTELKIVARGTPEPPEELDPGRYRYVVIDDGPDDETPAARRERKTAERAAREAARDPFWTRERTKQFESLSRRRATLARKQSELAQKEGEWLTSKLAGISEVSEETGKAIDDVADRVELEEMIGAAVAAYR